ncbi:MAG: hypothetical protein R3C45_10950 [Phycisphaerales bacterium]
MAGQADLTDFAPTVMHLLGREPAEHMTGNTIFVPANQDAGAKAKAS